MSLTSYRAAPPRVNFRPWGGPAGPGSDLLFRALRRSTIGAEGFHGRVRDGIGCFAPRYDHQAVPEVGDHRSEIRGLWDLSSVSAFSPSNVVGSELFVCVFEGGACRPFLISDLCFLISGWRLPLGAGAQMLSSD